VPTANVGDLRIEFGTTGAPANPAVLLIAGLGDQLVYWPDRFCERLAERGLFAIRYDNRDVGLSSRVEREYDLDDMGDDGLGALDALGIDAAHLAGMSQGGMIAQRLALTHPERVRTLTLMASIGDFRTFEMDPEVMAPFMTPPGPGREGYADWFVGAMRTGGSPDVDEAWIRGLGETIHDRGVDPMGVMRQMMASAKTGFWHEDQPSITAPTLVIHGERDRVFPPRFGGMLADAIPGAELVVLPGRGPDLPWGVEEELADRIADSCRRVV
jgi:pimeloyl-ACP methyl ester carboxylesterase